MQRPVEELRSELRTLGYLNRGIERWFALDPWSSRTFWGELLTLALKAATLLAVFATPPIAAITFLRNAPLPLYDAVVLSAIYLAGTFLTFVALIILIGLLLKLSPGLIVDRPRVLLPISLAVSLLVAAAIGLWWAGFEQSIGTVEALAGATLILLFFVVATFIFSAVLLSFSIHETGRIPSLHQRRRTIPLTAAGILLLGTMLLPAYFHQRRDDSTPAPQVVVAPSTARMVLLAVDGLSAQIFAARSDLSRLLPTTSSFPPEAFHSSAERWASIGTGTPPTLHGVETIDGVRIEGSRRMIQSVSRADVFLYGPARWLGLIQREALPPTIRRRDYVWEILAARGVSSAAINWWASETTTAPNLLILGQEALFREASTHGSPQQIASTVDAIALQKLTESLQARSPRFGTAYLPALDIILNRLDSDESGRLAASVAILDRLTNEIKEFRSLGYDVMVIGVPGDDQRGAAVLASNLHLAAATSTYDLAPTLFALFGFPASGEMPGESRAGEAPERIETYGNRDRQSHTAPVDEEYYEQLKSLGYIQ